MRREGASGSWITAGFVKELTYKKGKPVAQQMYILHPVLKCCPGTSRCHNSIMGSVLYVYVCANIFCGIYMYFMYTHIYIYISVYNYISHTIQ